MSSQLTAAEILVKLGVDTKALIEGLKDADERTEGFYRDQNGRLRDAKGRYVKAGEESGKGFANGFKKMAIGAAAGAGALFVGSLVKGLDIDKANDKLAAQLGLNDEQSKRMGKVAGSLYADAYGDSMEDVNEALNAVRTSIKGMANASDSDLKSATATAMDFANTFDTDVSRAAQVAGQMMKNGLAKDSTEAFDLLTKASQKVPANVREDLMDAADEYGPFFKSMGYSGSEAMAMLVDASDKGMYGIDKLGDGIKEFSIRATDGSDSTKAAFGSLGLDAGKMADDLLAGGEQAHKATQKTIAALLNMKDPAKRAQTALALFGTPLEDLNVTEIPRFLKSMQGASGSMDGFKGSAKKMSATVNGNAATSIEGLKRKAEALFLKIANWAIPIVTKWAATFDTQLMPAIKKVGNFLKEHVLPVLQDVGHWIQKNSDWLVPLVGVLVAAAVAYRTVVAITKAWTIAQGLLNAVMMLNPIGLVVAAIVALVAIFVIAYKKSDTFRGIVDGLWSVMKRIAGWVADKFVSAFKAAAEVFGWVKDKARSAIGWVKEHWPLLLAILTGPIGLAVLLIAKNWDRIKDGARAAKDWIVDKFNSLVTFFRELPGKIGDLGEKFMNAGKGLIGKFFEGLRHLGDLGKKVGTDLLNAIVGAINAGIQSVNDAIPDDIGFEVAGKQVGFNLPNNPFPKVPELATGAYVAPTNGGTIARLGEAGEGEWVIPRSKAPQWAREFMALSGSGSSTQDPASLDKAAAVLAGVLARYMKQAADSAIDGAASLSASTGRMHAHGL